MRFDIYILYRLLLHFFHDFMFDSLRYFLYFWMSISIFIHRFSNILLAFYLTKSE